MTVLEIEAWINTLYKDSNVAIGECNITLVELDDNNEETGAYLEVGSAPLERN